MIALIQRNFNIFLSLLESVKSDKIKLSQQIFPNKYQRKYSQRLVIILKQLLTEKLINMSYSSCYKLQMKVNHCKVLATQQ